jgi:hypothetical protein
MYGIELNCWYQERGGFNQKEFYNSLKFDGIEEASKYLYENIEEILDIYPVESIDIKPFN